MTGGSAQAASPAGQDADARAISDLRAQSNAAIAAHDADKAVAAMAAGARVLSSGGALVDGPAAMRAAFAGAFAETDFIRFVRTPDVIEPGSQGEASEQGHWVGLWKGGEISGRYMARWKRTPQGWRIQDELYVPLACSGLPRCRSTK